MNDYAYNLINKFVSVVCGLIVSVILARYLGVHLRGELAFITQVAGLIAIVVGMGVNHSFIYQFRNDPDGSSYAAVINVLLAQVALFALVSLSVATISGDRTAVLVVALAAATAGYQQFESIMAAYNIRLKINVNLAYSTLRLIAHLAMWWVSDSSLVVPVAIAVGSALLAVLAYLLLADGWRLGVPSLTVARGLYRFGWVPMVTTVLVVLNYSVDLVMLKFLGTSLDLGLYAVAAGVVTYLWVIPDSIKEVLVSRVVRTKEPHTVLLPLKAAVITALLSAALCAAGGVYLVPALFGEEFAGAYPMIVVLSIGVISMVYFKVLGIIVLAEGRRWFYFGALLAAVTVNALLNLAVIPEYGAIGAAWVCVVSYTFTGAAFVIYFSRMSRCPIRDVLLIGRSDLEALRRMGRRKK